MNTKVLANIHKKILDEKKLLLAGGVLQQGMRK
jgi:hypothetical protein